MPFISKENPDNGNEISIQHQITYSHLCSYNTVCTNSNSFYKFPSSSQRKDVQTRFYPNRSPFVTILPALGTFCVFSQYVQSRSEQIHVCEWNIETPEPPIHETKALNHPPTVILRPLTQDRTDGPRNSRNA